MEIKYQNIVLRDRRESDIDDDIRWNTVDTQWALWDAPWEMEVELPKFDPASYREEEIQRLSTPKEGFRWSFEVDTAEGCHIGSVNSYLIDENYDWIRTVITDQKVFYTLGIEICDSRFWGRGLGTQALTAFIRYHLEKGNTDLCLQTWSGNERMVRTARRLGFAVCHREEGTRQVRGGVYDGLTFRLDVDAFRRYLSAYGEIRYREIVLRDKRERDIDDWIRWYNEETQWAHWDAPEEPMEPVNPDEYRAETLEWMKELPPEFRTYFEITTIEGQHIGFINAYAIDENYK